MLTSLSLIWLKLLFCSWLQTATGTDHSPAVADAAARPRVSHREYRLELADPRADTRANASFYELGAGGFGWLEERLDKALPGLHGSPWYRAAEWAVGTVGMVYWMIWSHELGHRGAGRRFGWPSEIVEFGWGGARTASHAPATATPEQMLAFSGGGVDQAQLDAREIFGSWARDGQIRCQDAMAYFLAQTDLLLYAARTLATRRPPAWDDIDSWVHGARGWSTGGVFAASLLTGLATASVWAALIGQYCFLAGGERGIAMPVLFGGTVTWPRFQMLLTPAGPLLGLQIGIKAGRTRPPLDLGFDLRPAGGFAAALTAKAHDIPIAGGRRLGLSPFIRISFAGPLGIQAGADVNLRIAPGLRVGACFCGRINDLLSGVEGYGSGFLARGFFLLQF